MRISTLFLISVITACSANICSDLQEIGVPAYSARLQDSMLVVRMAGSLSLGDSLLKHYGGVFYTAVDSMLAGWEICGLRVRLEEAELVLRKQDMIEMFSWISETTDDEAIAEWVLNHTRVFRHSEADTL